MYIINWINDVLSKKKKKKTINNLQNKKSKRKTYFSRWMLREKEIRLLLPVQD